MKIPSAKLLSVSIFIAMALTFAAKPAHSAARVLDNTTVVAVSVNGGTDTTSPGTTCVRIATPVATACSAGYVAIQNNNKQLLATALQAKATSSNIWFYYDDAAGPFHCPGMVFTPCSVIGIELK